MNTGKRFSRAIVVPIVALSAVTMSLVAYASIDEFGDCNGNIPALNNQKCVFVQGLVAGSPVDCEATKCHDASYKCPNAACSVKVPPVTGPADECEHFLPDLVVKYGNGCLDQPPETSGKKCQKCTSFACSIGWYYEPNFNVSLDNPFYYGCSIKICQEVRWRNAGNGLVCKP